MHAFAGLPFAFGTKADVPNSIPDAVSELAENHDCKSDVTILGVDIRFSSGPQSRLWTLTIDLGIPSISRVRYARHRQQSLTTLIA